MSRDDQNRSIPMPPTERGSRYGIYKKLLLLSLIISMTPILLLGFFTALTMNNAKDEIVGEIETAFDSKERDAIELQAFLVADAVSNFLKQREMDLSNLIELNRTRTNYAEFSKLHRSEIWIRTGYNDTPHEARLSIPIYKEIAYIDKDGNERIKIVDGTPLPRSALKNVAKPENTRFGVEDYFNKTVSLKRNEIYVSHLYGYHMSRPEQLGSARTIEEAVESPTYSGVIYMTAPVYDDTIFDGIVVLAIDHQHLMEFTQHILPNSKEQIVFPVYSSGDYAFMFDDRGWIITHPKYWDIPGVDKDGNWVKAYNPNSSEEEIEEGRIPFNLDTAGFVHENYPIVAQAVRRKESGSVVTTNIGGVKKMMAYSPILYSNGEYERYGIFGGITIGAELDQFRQPTARFAENLSATITLLRDNSILLVLFTFIITAIAAWLFSRRLAQPIVRMTAYARQLGSGEDVEPIEIDSNDEIGELSTTLNQMAADLQLSNRELIRSLDSLRESKSEIENYSRELEYQVSIFRSIQEVGNILGTSADMEKVLKFIMQSCVDSLEFDRAVLYLTDKDEKYLEYQEQCGLSEEDEERVRRSRFKLAKHDCVETRVLRTGQMIYVEDFAGYEDATNLDKRIYKSSRSDSFVFIPLRAKEKVIGILGADKFYTRGQIRQIDIHSLQIFANQVARLLENSQLYLEIVRQRNFFENIIRRMIRGIVTIDSARNVTSINQAAESILGISSDLALGGPISEISNRSVEHQKRFGPVIDLIQGGSDQEILIEFNDRLVTVAVSAIGSESSRQQGHMIVLEDITEKKRIDDRIRHLDRLATLGKFAAGIAHEIRNPLTGLSVFLDDMHDRVSSSIEDTAFIRMAMNEIERLERLVNELLEYSSPGRESKKLGDINQVVESTLRFTSKQCEEKGLVVEEQLQKDLPSAYIDSEKIRQALLNLVLNAIQILDHGGKIRVSTSLKQESRRTAIALAVEDSGPGIPPDEVQQIFEPFHTHRKGGTGLGLSIAQSVITDHQGYIEVGPSELGGAKFVVYLPAMQSKIEQRG